MSVLFWKGNKAKILQENSSKWSKRISAYVNTRYLHPRGNQKQLYIGSSILFERSKSTSAHTCRGNRLGSNMPPAHKGTKCCCTRRAPPEPIITKVNQIFSVAWPVPTDSRWSAGTNWGRMWQITQETTENLVLAKSFASAGKISHPPLTLLPCKYIISCAVQ